MPAEALFQDGLANPETEAARLGFTIRGIPTLDTNCNAMFAYHFTETETEFFGLVQRR